MSKCLIISIFVLVILSLSTADKPNTKVIPALWCLDASIAEQCDVLPQCQAYNKSMYNQKFNLTLIYLVGCEWCNKFINETLYTDIWMQFRDYVNLELWPYDGPYFYDNRVHACVMHTLADISRWFPFIHCLSEQFMAHDEPEFNESVAYCFNDQKIKQSEQKKILDCAAGPLGWKLQEEFMAKGDAAKPEKPWYGPWLVLNGISTSKSIMYKNNLLWALCSWYSGDPVPKPCRLENLFRDNGNEYVMTDRNFGWCKKG